jgi:Pentapeptide repeats (9 copies)
MNLDKLLGRVRNNSEKQEDLSKRVSELYAKHNQPSPSEDVLLAINYNSSALTDIEQVLSKIESARRGRGYLDKDDIKTAIEYGVKNLSCIKIVSLSDLNLKGIDFQDTRFVKKSFINCDFSDSNLTNAELTRTDFDYSILDTVHMDSIQIDGKQVELWDRPAMVEESNWDLKKTSIESVDTCSDCEKWNGRILTHESEEDDDVHYAYSRRGILLFQGDIPLGYMKLKGEDSFLAIRTVTSPSGEVILWKGMVYALEWPLRNTLTDKSSAYRNEKGWRRVDIEKIKDLKAADGTKAYPRIGRNNIRFVMDPQLYPLMTDLVDRIEAGTEPMIDILTEN